MLAPLNRIIIFVYDVQKSADFYRHAFDMKSVATEEATDEWQELEAGQCRLVFHKAYGVDGPTGSPNNPHKIVFYSDDVATTVAELKSRGVEMGNVKTFGNLTLCDGHDPEGHPFQISNRG